MRIVKCDKCLREWTEESYPYGLVVMADYVPGRRSERSIIGSLSNAPIELCASCARHFRNWLDEVEKYGNIGSET